MNNKLYRIKPLEWRKTLYQYQSYRSVTHRMIYIITLINNEWILEGTDEEYTNIVYHGSTIEECKEKANEHWINYITADLEEVIL